MYKTIATILMLTPSLLFAQVNLNFTQDGWRYPPIVIDGTPIMRDSSSIEIPFCADSTTTYSCLLDFSVAASGFTLTLTPPEFTEEVVSTYIFDLTSTGQLTVPVVYLDGDPLVPICNVSLELNASGSYTFHGIGQCSPDLVVPQHPVASLEWIQSDEVRVKNTALAFIPRTSVPPAIEGASWMLANPGDTISIGN